MLPRDTAEGVEDKATLDLLRVPARVAAAHGVSLRYLHAVFAEQGFAVVVVDGRCAGIQALLDSGYDIKRNVDRCNAIAIVGNDRREALGEIDVAQEPDQPVQQQFLHRGI